MARAQLWTKDFVVGVGLNLAMSMVFYLLMTSMAGYAVARFSAGEAAAAEEAPPSVSFYRDDPAPARALSVPPRFPRQVRHNALCLIPRRRSIPTGPV